MGFGCWVLKQEGLLVNGGSCMTAPDVEPTASVHDVGPFLLVWLVWSRASGGGRVLSSKTMENRSLKALVLGGSLTLGTVSRALLVLSP